MLSKDSDPDFIIILIVSIGIILLFITTVISLIYLSRRRFLRYQFEKQVMKQTYEQEKLKAEIEVQEQTFTFLSEEIHDNIGQSLSLVKLNLNMGSAVQVQQAKVILTTVIQDLRSLAQNLNTDKLKNKSLVELIKTEIDKLRQTQVYQVEFIVSTDGDETMPDNQILIFRIFQESINNIIKHAAAKNIIVKLSILNQEFILEIIDDGVGFDTNLSHEGIGLMNIKKRVELIGGQYQINSSIGNGSHFILKIDMQKLLFDEAFTK